MNTVKLSQSYKSTRLEILINNEPVSAYSELVSLAGKPFTQWVSRILGELDEEVYDSYTVELYAFPFQYEILKYYQKFSNFCKGINFHEINSLYDIDYIKRNFHDICSRYRINVEENAGIKLYSEIPVRNRSGVSTADLSKADVCIVTDPARAAGRTNIVLSGDETCVFLEDSKKIVYKIGANLIEKFLDYYLYEAVDSVFIEKCLNAFQYTSMKREDAVFVQSVISNEPAYYIGDIPQLLDEGSRTAYTFRSWPENAFSFISSDPSILKAEQNMLVGLGGGSAQVIIEKKSGEAVWKQRITVIAHNYATDIKFIPRFSSLKLHERNRFEIVVLPADAEDMNSLEWSIEPYSLAQITNDGSITALQVGSGTVRVKGRKTEASFPIEVCTGIDRMWFENQKVTVFTGETTIVECSISPANAIIDKLEWTFDNCNIAACNPSRDGRKCQIIASENFTGTGNLRCTDSGSGLSAICNVVVEKNKIKDLLAGLTVFFMIIGLFSSAFAFLSIAVAAFGLWKYWGKKKNKAFWIGGIVSALILLSHLSGGI